MAPFSLPPPLAVAEPVTDLPEATSGMFEAKLDGWRCCALTGPAPRLWSRHGTDLTAAFSEVAEACRVLPEAVLDGELVAVDEQGRLLFHRLQTRQRGPRPGEGFTVLFEAFDLLAVGAEDWRGGGYLARRGRLEELLRTAPPAIRPVPATADRVTALRWVGGLGGGIEGLVVKPDVPYRAGPRSGWVKWRQRHTVDAVVVGVTVGAPARQAVVLAQEVRGRLRPVGVSLPLGAALRRELAPLLVPSGVVRELSGTVGGLPGADPIRYLPVEPTVVVECEADQVAPAEFGRFRHRLRVTRIRDDT
jgi:ATP-dependent DNA ligase